jgi:hypothetical protein
MNDIGFTQKPTDIRFMGKLRERMIQQGWQYMDDEAFINRVCHEGFAFYGCLFDGHDLMELGQQRLCWKAQTIIGVDIDKTLLHPLDMVHIYQSKRLDPWLVYPTFSDGKDHLRSYRLLWKVETDLSRTYEEWRQVIKALNNVTPLGDKHAQDCTRMWQGSNAGPVYHQPFYDKWSYQTLTERLNLA